MLVAAALAGQFACDFVVSSLRVHIGVGVELRSLLRPFGWVYLVDLLLLPIGVLAALVPLRAPVARRGGCRSPRCSRSSPASAAAGSTTPSRCSG